MGSVLCHWGPDSKYIFDGTNYRNKCLVPTVYVGRHYNTAVTE